MKYGFNLLLWTTFVTEADYHLFTLLKEAGYDGVEIPTGDGPLQHYEHLATVLADSGLEVTGVAMGLPEADPSSADAKIRQAGLDRLRSRIECLHAIGGHILGGPLYAAHKEFRDEPLCDDDYKRAAEVLAQACEDAEAADITMCLEPLNRFEIALVNTTEQARRIVDLAGHARVRIHYDTHHGHIEERSHEQAFRDAGDRLGHLHLSESHRGILGSGLVDWQGIRRGIREVGYDGWCTVEAFSMKVDGIRQAANVHRDTYESRSELARAALPFLRQLVEGDGEFPIGV